MLPSSGNRTFELVYAIVNHGQGSRVLHIAKDSGMAGGTIVLGSGTVGNRILQALALCDIRKEIVLTAADTETAGLFLERLSKTLKLHKPNHGIAYSVPISRICGSRGCASSCDSNSTEGTEPTMYQSVIIIVEKGNGEAVVDAATKAGATGATLINARGSGIHETAKLFAMEIEPEKEIVLMIMERAQTDAVVASIREEFQIDKPGRGVIFVQDVSRTYGLYE